ncbi:MAG: glutathione S-transferase family protein [Gammaproteobacteria bacterium]|nr:glutathione S-transferase family protein [Gammaproteobacteria bacterium]
MTYLHQGTQCGIAILEFYFVILLRMTFFLSAWLLLWQNPVFFHGYSGMSLTLYHSIESTCSQKVRFVMSEKKLEWEQINLNLRKGEQFTPEYLKLNRKAVVPTLIHDEKVLRESTVIIHYLDDIYPQKALKPEEPYARAMMNLLIKSFDEEVHPSVGILSYAIVLRHQMNELKTPAELEQHFENIVDPMRRQRQQSTHAKGLESPSAGQALETLGKVVSLMEEIKGDNEWLCGESFSLADACAAPYLVRMEKIGLKKLWQDKQEVGKWLKRAIERVNDYGLEQPWGSEAFHQMVAAHVDQEKTGIEKLIKERLG